MVTPRDALTDKREEISAEQLTEKIAEALGVEQSEVSLISDLGRPGEWTYGVRSKEGSKPMTQSIIPDARLDPIKKGFKLAS